ncbi:hypothetical protein HYH02_010074 [Chlamydomonas schloesseri]|uniref:Uncharacterized protein n=1 Tax=Chlamydomonas schloesseri TaxID=2026947 RepID=A0A835TM40_9CHLO|nr:hypothetical protein HYH02_010074 [Chlamydomonas schloesseri]|eukprot:KAG2441231.1 hypothetical protein HYH02_010074 [Chlamydomonas schloesseri]
MAPTVTQQCHQQPSSASAQHKGSSPAHHDLGGCASHRPAAPRHMVLAHTASVLGGPQLTQSPGVSALEQFGLGGVSDYPKLVSALTLVACSTLRPPATALLGLALLEEATQLHYELVSLE